MDWFLYDNGLRHERVKCFIDQNFGGTDEVKQFRKWNYNDKKHSINMI